MSDASTRQIGSGDFIYEPIVDWEQRPEGMMFNQAVGIDVDSQDQVFVFSRSDDPVVVFNRDGEFVKAWGKGLFARPHAIFITDDDLVYCTDDWGHAIYKFTPDGELLQTIGTPGEPSNSGVENRDYRTIKQPGGPFNLPTMLAPSPDGEFLYISDGYGNCQVHKYTVTGEHVSSWGEAGRGRGQFLIPHGISVRSDGTVFVCDRENSRIQLFSPDGEYLDEWTEPARPCQAVFGPDGNVYVAEIGFKVGMSMSPDFPGREMVPSRVGVYSPQGDLLTRFGEGEYGLPGETYAAHGIAVDSHGDLYVGEVRPDYYRENETPKDSAVPAGAPVFQKIRRM